mmetsp:Transcript_19313/g.59438  ORF Transcript_19313/g.59438 Transcript_19313/m.59438 type:complete len:317 (-) Transcript_19313:272-1222(-)
MLECAPASERDGIRPVLRNVRGGGRRRVDLRSLDEPAHERLEILARQGVIVDKGWKCSVERRGGRPDLSIAISQRQRVEPRRQRSRRPRVLQPHLARARRVRLDDARRLPDREDQAAERGRRRRELFRRREQHQLAEVGHAVVLETEEARVEAAALRFDDLEVVEDERRDVGSVQKRVRVVEAAVVLAERLRAVAPVGFDHCIYDRGSARPGKSRIRDRRAAHVSRPRDVASFQKHDAAVGVEEPREPDDRLALRRVLGEMKRLGDGDVEPARDDLFFGLPVISRFHELNIQARVREEARALCDDQREVVRVQEPL